MSVVANVLVLLHLLGMAAILSGWFASVRGADGMLALVWGARAQLVTGLLLVGLAEMTGWPLIHAKIAVKLLVALAVAGCAEMARVRAGKGAPTPQLVHAAAGLTVLNVLVAVFWTSQGG